MTPRSDASTAALIPATAVAGTAGVASDVSGLPGVPGTGGVPTGALRLPAAAGIARRWHRLRSAVALHPLAGRLALGTILLLCLVEVVFATAGPSSLVPRSHDALPGWEEGPLAGIVGHLTRNTTALSIGLTVVVFAVLIAYFVALGSVRNLSMRFIATFVVAAHLILLMSPPQQLTDVFNYLGYAHLGGLHGLNPYTHVIFNELHDPIFRFATWYHLPSPYGPLFTVLSYPLAFLPLAAAYWTLKAVTVGMSLLFVWLVARCARLLGRDPRFAVLFVAANPVFLLWALTGFHNDFFMLVPSTAAIALMLARRDRAAGIAIVVAVAVKFTAVLLLPFLLVAVAQRSRRLRLLTGCVAAGIPLLAMYLVVFGLSLPNLSDQSTLLTGVSVPNVVGWLIGFGGGSVGLLRVAKVGLVVSVAVLLRRRSDWLASAGWSTFVLIASLAWLVPWYVVWLLPLAALGRNLALRRLALGFTVYLVLAFTPTTGMLLSRLHINLMGGPPGQASQVLQHKLEQ